jgi:hypothetical protein
MEWKARNGKAENVPQKKETPYNKIIIKRVSSFRGRFSAFPFFRIQRNIFLLLQSMEA